MVQGGCDIKSWAVAADGGSRGLPQAAIDASPDVLLVIDAEGILRWASPSLASLGYDPVGQVGVQVLDYVHPDDLGYALGMLTEAVRRPGEHSLPVFRVQHGAGHTVEVEASVANVADGGFEGLLLVSSCRSPASTPPRTGTRPTTARSSAGATTSTRRTASWARPARSSCPGCTRTASATIWRKGYDRDFEAYAVTAQHPALRRRS